MALYNLAHALLRVKRRPEAESAARESLELAVRIESTHTVVWDLVLLAAAARLRGETKPAATLLGAVHAQCERTGLELRGAEADIHDETANALEADLGPTRLRGCDRGRARHVARTGGDVRPRRGLPRIATSPHRTILFTNVAAHQSPLAQTRMVRGAHRGRRWLCQIRVRSRRQAMTTVAPVVGAWMARGRTSDPRSPLRPPFDRVCKLGVAGSSVLGPPHSIPEDSTGDSTGSQVSHLSHVAQRTAEPNRHESSLRNGRCRTRTCGHLRVRQALYQLS